MARGKAELLLKLLQLRGLAPTPEQRARATIEAVFVEG